MGHIYQRLTIFKNISWRILLNSYFYETTWLTEVLVVSHRFQALMHCRIRQIKTKSIGVSTWQEAHAFVSPSHAYRASQYNRFVATRSARIDTSSQPNSNSYVSLFSDNDCRTSYMPASGIMLCTSAPGPDTFVSNVNCISLVILPAHNLLRRWRVSEHRRTVLFFSSHFCVFSH